MNLIKNMKKRFLLNFFINKTLILCFIRIVYAFYDMFSCPESTNDFQFKKNSKRSVGPKEWNAFAHRFRANSITVMRCLTPHPYGWPRGYVGPVSHFVLLQKFFDFEPLPTVEGVWCRLITHSYECLVIMEAQRVLEWKKKLRSLWPWHSCIFSRGLLTKIHFPF